MLIDMLKLSRCSHRTGMLRVGAWECQNYCKIGLALLRVGAWECQNYHKIGLALLQVAQASYLICNSAQSSHGMIPDMVLAQ